MPEARAMGRQGHSVGFSVATLSLVGSVVLAVIWAGIEIYGRMQGN